MRQTNTLENLNTVTLILLIATLATCPVIIHQHTKCGLKKGMGQSFLRFFNPVTLTLKTAPQYFRTTLHLVMIHQHIQFGRKDFSSPEDMEDSFLRVRTLGVTVTLKTTIIFFRMTLSSNYTWPYYDWLQKNKQFKGYWLQKHSPRIQSLSVTLVLGLESWRQQSKLFTWRKSFSGSEDIIQTTPKKYGQKKILIHHRNGGGGWGVGGTLRIHLLSDQSRYCINGVYNCTSPSQSFSTAQCTGVVPSFMGRFTSASWSRMSIRSASKSPQAAILCTAEFWMSRGDEVMGEDDGAWTDWDDKGHGGESTQGESRALAWPAAQ